MKHRKHDVFISYRRDGGFETARYIYDNLVRDGYTATFDIDTLRNGRFDDALLARIDECTDFVIILNRGCFDRTIDPDFPRENDWMRRELSHALAKKKNIIPIMIRGFEGFPGNLPDDVKDIQWMNGPKYEQEYVDAFYERLKSKFLRCHPDEGKISCEASRHSDEKNDVGWVRDVFSAVRGAFCKYAVFTGRSKRGEFWYFALFYMAVLFTLEGVFGSGFAEDGEDDISTVSAMFTLVMFCPALAVTVRRLHDIGKSGKLAILAIVPFAQFYLFYLLALPSAQDSQHN